MVPCLFVKKKDASLLLGVWSLIMRSVNFVCYDARV